MRSKEGTRIEIANFSEWFVNSKEIVSFSEWLANRITLRTMKGARIEIASFSEWLANRKRCAQRKGARMEIASFSEWLASRNGVITSENPFGGLRAFQNGFATTRSDADAAHMRKASGIMQMRQTRQIQIDEDACIRNWADKIATPETCKLSATTLILTTLIQRLCGSLWP